MTAEPTREPVVRVGFFAVAALVLSVLLAVGAAVADVLEPPPPPPAAAPVPQEQATAGTWYCPAVAGEEEPAVLTVAAADLTATTATVVRHTAEGPVADEAVEVAPGEPFELVLDGGQASVPVSVRWRGGPAVVGWRVEGPDSAGAPCEPAPSPTWYVTGFQTNAASQSILHLLNPFAQDAVARLEFLTPEGRVALVATDSILVPAGQHLGVDLNLHQPELADLGVMVEVLSGRMVAQGETRFAPTAGTPAPTGRALLPASPAPATEWHFGWSRAGPDARSWLVLANPGQREAAIELRVSDPMPEGESLLGEVPVPGGSVVRLDLAGASAGEEFGIAVTSVNEVPLLAARLTDQLPEGGRPGVAASLGASADARSWLVVGGGARDRGSTVSLYNPTGETVTVNLDAGDATPDDWRSIVLDPNGYLTLDLSQAGQRDAVALRVVADGLVVPELRTRAAGDNARFWSAVGVASSAWTGPTERPPVRRDPALSTTTMVIRRPPAVGPSGPAPVGPADQEAPPAEEDPAEEPPAG
jgi:hypothetical protein